MDAISDSFNRYFANWGITLPEAHRKARAPGVIVASGWHIRFVFGREGQREYLDFYAQHRMTNDRHERLYDDGETVTLESLQELSVHNPNLPGDKERAQEAYFAHNRRVGALIAEKFAACVEHEES